MGLGIFFVVLKSLFNTSKINNIKQTSIHWVSVFLFAVCSAFHSVAASK